MSDPSLPSADGTCHLFRLPREIRDNIYKFTLLQPKGLFYQHHNEDEKEFKLYPTLASAGSEVEANQLKYVCQQLHTETAGLGIKFNDLNFVAADASQPSASIQFIRFLTQSSQKQQHDLRHVHLRTLFQREAKSTSCETHEKSLARRRTIIDFCRSHPKAVVNIHLEIARHQNQWESVIMFLTVCNFLVSYRDRDLDQLLPTHWARNLVLRRIPWNRGEWPVEYWNVPNLRFWPSSKPFNEETFRYEFENKGIGPALLRDFEGGIDALVKEVKEWFAHGF